METINLLIAYILRSLPGLTIGVIFLVTLGRRALPFRITAYLLLFILVRDVLTPLKLWSFGDSGIFWLRVIPEPIFLSCVAVLSIGIVLVIQALDPEVRKLSVLIKESAFSATLWGLAGIALIVSVMALAYWGIPLNERGGPVSHSFSFLISLLFFCLSVNFYEESLFRGYVQGYLEKEISPIRAALLSGILFSLCHSFLASTVTDVGWGVLIFTLFEGIVAGFVRMRAGVIASTLTHGGAVFMLASGLI